MSHSDGGSTPRVLFKYRKSEDVECHVRLMQAGEVSYIEFRDWLRTKDAYGRGYWVDTRPEVLLNIASALMEVADEQQQ